MRGRLAALAAALLTMAAPAVPAAAASAPVQRLRVLTLNIFYGGDDLDLATGGFCAVPDGCPATLRQIEKLIRESGADVVGLQEAERNTERIAADLGWHGSNHAHVLSRFPIIDPPGAGGRYVFVETEPGRVIAVADTHLPSDPYGPYLVRDGGTLGQVLALEEQTRVPAVRDLARTLPALAAKGLPVFLTGDFNSPSPLDWTPAVAAVRADVPYPVRWPAGQALLDAGLHDTFRDVHPNPVRVPGLTWTPGSPEEDPHEVFDRIDWVLRDGPVRTVDSQVVGESGGPGVGIGISPYPTDHRGVVSTVDVRPAVPPALVAPASARGTIGRPLAVHFAGPGRRVVLRDGHGRTVAAVATAGRPEGDVRLPTTGLARGQYQVSLESPGKILSRARVWLYPPGEPTRVSVDHGRYRVGEPIGIGWSNAPGMQLDWVSVFRCPSTGACDDTSGYLVYAYTGGTVQGHLVLGPDSIAGTGSWPLPAGRYVARLLPDDGYRSVAESARFTVTG